VNIEIGKSYVTRGGWLATAIYEISTGDFVVVHFRPGDQVEEVEMHRGDGVYLTSGCKSAWDLVKEADGTDWELPRVAVIGGCSMNRSDLNLQAGRKYLTQRLDNGEAGPTINLRDCVFTVPPVRAMLPFCAQVNGDESSVHYVTRDGAIFRTDHDSPCLQITGEYREPTIAERLEKWRAKDRAERTQGEFAEIVAAVRKLEGGSK
jgi:hypothetical protein